MQATSFFGFGLDTYGAWDKRAEEFVELMVELAPMGEPDGHGAVLAQLHVTTTK
jgi:hypothetical protein